MSKSNHKRNRRTTSDVKTDINLTTASNSPNQTPKRMAFDDESFTLTKLNDMLNKQSESIISFLTKKFKDEIQTLADKLKIQFNLINKNIVDINLKIQELENSNTQTNTEINLLKSEVNTANTCSSSVKSELNDTKIEIDVNKNKICSIQKELADALLIINDIDNKQVSRDAVMYGVPHTPNENITSIFNKLCRTLDITAPIPDDMFRTRPRRQNDNNSVIIIKFKTAYDKNFVLSSIAKRIKGEKKQLCLKDVGFESNSTIFLRESLSKKSNLLVRHGLQLKKQNKIAAVFTIRGRVYVKRLSTDVKGVCVDNVVDIDRIAS